MAAYRDAAVGKHVEPIPRSRGSPGTFDHLVADYFSSAGFLRLAPSSQVARVIERFVNDEDVGHRLIGQMTRAHVQKIIGRRAQTPGAANDLLKKIKILIHHAIENGWCTDDPTTRIKKYPAGDLQCFCPPANA
jgi:hypothetical protein